MIWVAPVGLAESRALLRGSRAARWNCKSPNMEFIYIYIYIYILVIYLVMPIYLPYL